MTAPGSSSSSQPVSIAGYRIEGVLGGGAMSTVYLARSPTEQQWAALKVLPAEMARNPALRESFLQEDTTTARLGHPNVVAIYGHGETTDGQLWIAMEYVEGTDAEAALRAGTMTPRRALRIVSEVASVLDYARDRGVVHQDVKPSNILLGQRHGHQERVVLSDFGAALTAERTDPADSPLMASVAYAAPEVLMGHPVDGRADVYSLGCSLFRLLTNRYPFAGDGGIASTITAQLHQAPPTVTEVLPWADSALDEVFATALAKNPDARYPSAGDLAAAAATAWAGTGRSSLPLAAPDVFSKAVRKSIAPRLRPGAPHRRLLAAGSLAAFVLIALAVWLAIPSPTPAPAPVAESPTSTAPATNELLERLKALLPSGYPAGSCAPATAATEAAVALSCGSDLDPGGPSTATYSLARNLEGLHAQFAHVIGTATMVVCPGNIQSPGPWRHLATPNVVAGTVFCGVAAGQPIVVWTNDSELLLARTETATTDLNALYTWWSSHS